MNDERSINADKQALIEEIHHRVQWLIATDVIHDDEKILIARNVLHLMEHEEKESETEKS